MKFFRRISLMPKDYPNLTAQQVADKMGINYQTGANMNTTRSALNRYLPFTYVWLRQSGQFSKAKVKGQISENEPFCIGFLTADASGGHMCAAYGYQDWPTTFIINIMEPNNGRRALRMTDSECESLVLGNRIYNWYETLYIV